MTVAYKLGASVVVNYVGRVPESEDDPDWPLLVETLADIGRHGQRVGATFCARQEPSAARTWHAWSKPCRPARWAWILIPAH